MQVTRFPYSLVYLAIEGDILIIAVAHHKRRPAYWEKPVEQRQLSNTVTAPSSLIINSAFVRPAQHWEQARDGTLNIISARRPAGYEIFDVRNNKRRTELLHQVNEIRGRVDTWREATYPGITSVTRKLLEHWHDASARDHPFYFCQLEAIETLIWWVEAAPEFKQGIFLKGDGAHGNVFAARWLPAAEKPW